MRDEFLSVGTSWRRGDAREMAIRTEGIVPGISSLLILRTLVERCNLFDELRVDRMALARQAIHSVNVVGEQAFSGRVSLTNAVCEV
jgi:hypothetical protein